MSSCFSSNVGAKNNNCTANKISFIVETGDQSAPRIGRPMAPVSALKLGWNTFVFGFFLWRVFGFLWRDLGLGRLRV